MMKSSQKIFYENPKLWEKEPPSTVLERIALTISAVPTDVSSILDVGSGNGLLISGLNRAGYKPVAADISINALKQIRKAEKVQAEAASLPFLTDYFDLVFACELLEHIPEPSLNQVLNEISRVSRKYIIITTPYQEKLEWSYARCHACGCIFNGAYHVRSFNNDIQFLFKQFECISLQGIVDLLHPDRTTDFELFIRHRLGSEYLYFSPSVTCPLCFSPVDRRSRRNWIAWGAAGIRYLYRMLSRKKRPLWYLAVFRKIHNIN